jgi:uncharacterized protein (DUF1499 family)
MWNQSHRHRRDQQFVSLLLSLRRRRLLLFYVGYHSNQQCFGYHNHQPFVILNDPTRLFQHHHQQQQPFHISQSNHDIEKKDISSQQRRQLVFQSMFLGTATTITILPNDAIAVVGGGGNQNEDMTNIQPMTKQVEFATSAGRHNCTTLLDPSKTTVTCYGDISMDQIHLSSISSTENGISTSAIRNPIRYSPPWSYSTKTSNATKAWNSLYNTVLQIDPNVQVIQYTDTYLHVTVATKPFVGSNRFVSSSNPFDSNDGDNDDIADNVDDMEFVLRHDDNLILYRSASRKSIFVYPLTQSVSDRNSHYDRLQRIRQTLGWQEFI